MPSVRIGNDGGEVIRVGTVLYTKAGGQPSAGAIDSVPNISNIVQKIWDYDDNNSLGGATHRTWTACEMGVCQYGKKNTVDCASFVTFNGNGVDRLLYTAPAGGILRLYANFPDGWVLGTKINDSFIWSSNKPSSFNKCWTLRLVTNDVVKVYPNGNFFSPNGVYGYFLPNVYP